MSSGPKSTPDRDQTDESLRDERDKTDRAFAQRQAAAREDADQVVQRARAKADAVLATARDRADERVANQTSAVSPAAIVEGRKVEDEALRKERDTADASLQRERDETERVLARLLPAEREKTDRFLLTERGRSDTEIAHRDDFLGMVSHDLRNLLGGVVLSATTLSEKAGDSDIGREVASTVARIERYAARMNRLIGDLVDVASLDAGVLAMTRARHDARKLVVEAVEMFRTAAAAKHIELEAEVTGDELLAELDHERVLQVFANLLSNAIKFTAAGNRIIVRAAREQDALHFSVQDTGVGVPEDMLELIFERFWQANKNDRRGTGLGLYISRSIVEAHGGRICAERAAEGGTTVHFTIPISPIQPIS
jgi:signal transduction histidine kinase